MMSEQTMAGLRILVVEDQEESRMLLRGMLRDLGITQVFEADDGRTGLKMLRSRFDMIDLILCDWNMPIMSGLEFLHQVRNDSPDIPFMMVTGRGDTRSVIEARKCGVNDYIRKPYSPIQIEAKLRILLQRMKAA